MHIRGTAPFLLPLPVFPCLSFDISGISIKIGNHILYLIDGSFRRKKVDEQALQKKLEICSG
jgi:hypothetical protein